MECSSSLTPRFVNNGYVTPEIIYITAHMVMRYSFGHGLPCAVGIYEFHLQLYSSLKSMSLITPASFFCHKIALAIQDLLYFHTHCKIFCSNSVENAICNLIGIALNLQAALTSIVIFTILIPSTQGHGISLHLFVSSLISFIIISQFSEYRSFCP